MIKKLTAALLSLIFVLSLAACGDKENTDPEIVVDEGSYDLLFSKGDLDGGFSREGATIITFGNSIEISGGGAKEKDGTVTLSGGGTYIFSGEGEGQITVDASSTDKPRLVLDGLTLHNENGPAIYVKSADKVFITLADGSENTLSDGESYSLTDGDTVIDAALFSRDDLAINGGGTLNINGNCKHAVISKDDLVAVGATLRLDAKNVALGGKDCVKLSDVRLTASAGTDGIRSDNIEDPTRGFVLIENSTLNITSGNDGIQAETLLKIDGCETDITCGGGSVNASYTDRNEFFGGWGFGGYEENESDTTESAKALKSSLDAVLSGGNHFLDSADDCIHSNGTITISGGEFTLSSGDDGIHADDTLSISGGTITVNKSYEGLEATNINVSGGQIKLKATDDGINAAGGNDQSAMGGRPGQGRFEGDNGKITVSGGTLLIDAAGDGLDSNGGIYISGGITLCSGPTNSGNGALDYASECVSRGGTLIALGSAGMATGFTSAESGGAIFCSFSTLPAGTSFALCDQDGNALLYFESEKAYSSAAVCSPLIESGKKYLLIAGGSAAADYFGFAEKPSLSGGETIAEITMTSALYSEGGFGMGGPGGGMGGGMGRPEGMPGGPRR